MMRTVETMVGLLALVCIALSSVVVDGGRRIQPPGTEDIQVEKKLKLLNNPFVKSIQSEDGDVIDCVDIYKQPAFNHPLLKNHTIKVPPSFVLTKGDTSASSIMNSSLLFSQVWHKSGSCPDGTIPIRRVLRQHLLNASSLERYGKKPMNIITKRDFHILDYTFALGIQHYHSTAMLITAGYSYTGAKAGINVWNPSVEADDEYTTGQMTLTSGPFNNSDTIEVGWMVNPSVYGDRQTRIFIYWTNDSGKSTGCLDLLCPGFVQVNKDVLLGGTIDIISSYRGQQYYIPVEVVKDFKQEVWWLITTIGNDTITIGYWPCDLFISMYKIAEMLMWGGDVYSPRMHTGRHTATAMGSGRFANEHYSMASYIKQPRMRDYSMTYKYPDPSGAVVIEGNCYSAENHAAKKFTEPLFYFGGPGRNLYCP